jgi:hypothetical protein
MTAAAPGCAPTGHAERVEEQRQRLAAERRDCEPMLARSWLAALRSDGQDLHAIADAEGDAPWTVAAVVCRHVVGLLAEVVPVSAGLALAEVVARIAADAGDDGDTAAAAIVQQIPQWLRSRRPPPPGQPDRTRARLLAIRDELRAPATC